MKQNVGSVDKIVRVVVGLALLGLTLLGMVGPWGWVGVVPLVSALAGFCPLYGLVGVNTRT